MSDLVATAPVVETSAAPVVEPNIKDLLGKGKSIPEEVVPTNDEKAGSRFAALARREKQMQEQRKQIQAQMAELEKYKKAEGLRTTNKAQWLKEMDVSFEDLTQDVINDGAENTPTVESKLSQIEKAMAEFEERQKKKETDALEAEKAAKEASERQYIEEQINAYKKGIKDTVEANADKYELVAANDAYDQVFEVVEQYFDATAEFNAKGQLVKPGQVLPVEKALEYVEDYLFEEAQKILKLKKFAPKAPSEVKVEAVQESKAQALKASLVPSSTTLTNSKITGIVPVEVPLQKLSVDESKRRAAALIKWS